MKAKYDDIKYIGFKSGKLTVTEVGLRSNKYPGSIWKCKCSCNGNIKEYRATLIANQFTKSCGCETINNKCSKFDSKEYFDRIYGDLQPLECIDNEKHGIYWVCKCIHCGDTTTRKAQEVVYGKTVRCRNKKCKRDRNLTNIKYNKELYLGKIYNFLEVLSYSIDNINNRDVVMWECKCLNCGNTIKLRASQVANNAYVSCGCIHISKHEKMLENIFSRNNITYRKEVQFDDLIGIGGGKPRFDFAIIDRQGNKKLIEYDGKQHFIDAFETSTWNTKRTIENDIIKNEYCERNNIELIRISKNFTLESDFEEYLKNNNII